MAIGRTQQTGRALICHSTCHTLCLRQHVPKRAHTLGWQDAAIFGCHSTIQGAAKRHQPLAWAEEARGAKSAGPAPRAIVACCAETLLDSPRNIGSGGGMDIAALQGTPTAPPANCTGNAWPIGSSAQPARSTHTLCSISDAAQAKAARGSGSQWGSTEATLQGG